MGTRSSRKQLESWTKNIAKKNQQILMSNSFEEFNRAIGTPKHPNTGIRTDIFDYQLDYFNAVQAKHKVILNKSRKIGATETGLRIIAFNCFDHLEGKTVIKGRYVGHRVMIVAGNKQNVANGFIRRFKELFDDGFVDMNGNSWTSKDIILNDSNSSVELFNGTVIAAYAASESVRGEADVVCVFMSESAFINLNDDSVVYKAVRPNISNIQNADFILESTPNGRSNFFYDIWDKAHQEPPTTDFFPLFQPYYVAIGKLLFADDIEKMKNEYSEDFFQQEYEGLFTTGANQEFTEDEIVKSNDGIDYFVDI